MKVEENIHFNLSYVVFLSIVYTDVCVILILNVFDQKLDGDYWVRGETIICEIQLLDK